MDNDETTTRSDSVTRATGDLRVRPAAHTRGPWTVRPGVYDTNPETACEFPHGPEIVAANGDTLAYCEMHTEAEAALMATAPKLLALLRQAGAHLAELTECAPNQDTRESAGYLRLEIERTLSEAMKDR